MAITLQRRLENGLVEALASGSLVGIPVYQAQKSSERVPPWITVQVTKGPEELFGTQNYSYNANLVVESDTDRTTEEVHDAYVEIIENYISDTATLANNIPIFELLRYVNTGSAMHIYGIEVEPGNHDASGGTYRDDFNLVIHAVELEGNVTASFIPPATGSSWNNLALGSASYALTASYALNGGGSTPSTGNATQSLFATQSLYATQSISASYATYAVSALTATSTPWADSANTSLSSLSASHALVSDSAITAENATSATNAENATNATSASYAETSSFAWNANLAANADNATSAANANNANFATTSTSASYALTSSYALNGGGTPAASATNFIATSSISASVNVGQETFKVVSGSNTLLFVSSSGNVGIGTTTPAAKLDVSGSVAVSGNISAKYTTLTSGSANGLTASFNDSYEIFNLTTGKAYNFTSSNLPSANMSTNTLLYVNNTATATSSLSFPSGWKNMSGGWPTSITSSKSFIIALTSFGDGTIFGSFTSEI